MSKYAERIKEVRNYLGQNQQEFSSLIDVGLSTLTGWEEDRHTPRPPTVRKITELINKRATELGLDPVNFHWLRTGEGEKFRSPENHTLTGHATGDVEVDETYLGGKQANKHKSKRESGTQGRSMKTKSVAFGMLERGGELRMIPLDDTKKKNIQPVIVQNIEQGSNIMTDDYKSYRGLNKKYNHGVVKHSLKMYVEKGNIHTNSVEGAFSLFKRGIIGIYHHISRKHLPLYLGEFSYRYNTREFQEDHRIDNFLDRCNGRLTYARLIS